MRDTAHRTTIGVFDSGFGGLTVLRALLPLIPSADYIYLGDTARLPYGSKSRETIARYAVSSARFLLDQGATLIVIACNTATALALDEVRTAAHPVPVLGVIEPGARATALNHPPPPSPVHNASGLLTHKGDQMAEAPDVLVLATAATVQSGAYTHALARLGIHSTEKACPLLVPLVEEGWIDHPVTRQVARIYLSEALAENASVNTLLFGCTHYPLLRSLIEQTLSDLHHPLRIVDSAEATARAVATHLQATAQTAAARSSCTFYATDSVDKFQRLGSHFLGHPLPHVHAVDLGG